MSDEHDESEEIEEEDDDEEYVEKPDDELDFEEALNVAREVYGDLNESLRWFGGEVTLSNYLYDLDHYAKSMDKIEDDDSEELEEIQAEYDACAKKLLAMLNSMAESSSRLHRLIIRIGVTVKEGYDLGQFEDTEETESESE